MSTKTPAQSTLKEKFITFIKDLNKSGALEGLINAKINEVDGLNIPEGAMAFQPQLIPALVNVTRRYGTERSTDLIEEGTGVWLHCNTSSGEPWSRRLLTERKKADKMTFIGASLIEMFIEQKRCSEEENQWLLDSDDSNLTSDDEGALDRYYDELYSTPESSPNTDSHSTTTEVDLNDEASRYLTSLSTGEVQHSDALFTDSELEEAEHITSTPQREPSAEKKPTAEGEPATTAKKPMEGTRIQSAPQREPAAAEEVTRKKPTIPCVPQSEPAAKIQPTAEGEPATVKQDDKEEDAKKPKVHLKSFPVFPQPTSDCPLCSQPVVRLSNHLIQKHSISTKEYRQKVLKQSRAMKCKEPKRQEGQQRRSFRDCPVPDCPSVFLPRIDKHLQRVHNYKTSSAEYHQLLSAAPDSKKETEEEEEEEDILVEMEDTPKEKLDIYERFAKYEEQKYGGTEQSKKNAQQHCRQVQAIKERLGISIRSMILPSSVQRITEVLRKDKKLPKTVSSYLLSLKKFSNYLSICVEASRSVGVCPTSAERTFRTAGDFATAMRPEICKRQKLLASKIQDVVMPAEKVDEMMTSCTEEAIAIARALESNSGIIPAEKKRKFRNILMALMLLNGGHRGCVITGLTLGEFQAAKQTTNGNWVIAVANHKTSSTYGPANVVLSPTPLPALRRIPQHHETQHPPFAQSSREPGLAFLPVAQREEGDQAKSGFADPRKTIRHREVQPHQRKEDCSHQGK
ncbi:hypothetical protein BSL78_11951 [Apostichopus japonicus]|uniref:Uncharacterized protein n=1 Tax=Stichopus japonicus TaxID=307972 RepID=A0A2G8KT36_STIJA|nr:hypothetical protein BSL78_11951 [Apostichopus japonicus]